MKINHRQNTQAGLWKTEVGWEVIDDMYYREGDSYSTIIKWCKEVCGDAPSSSVLSNHFNKSVREATALKNKLRRQTIDGLIQKRLSDFKSARPNPKPKPKSTLTITDQLFRIRIKDFKKDTKGKTMAMNRTYYWTEYRDELQKNRGLEKVDDQDMYTIPCEICGDLVEISCENSQGWAMDHRYPRSKGGTGLPDNLSIIHHNCNQIKSDLTLDELIQLSKKIVKNNS